MTLQHSRGKAVVVMIVLCLLLPVLTQSESTTPTTQVRGEILIMTSELIVMALEDGTREVFHLGKDMSADQSLKAGDRVEVRITPHNRIISATILTVEVSSQGSSAAKSSTTVS